MIKQILIEEGGFTSSFQIAKEKAKQLCIETKKEIIIVPLSRLVYDRFVDKTYGIYALCDELSDRNKERVQLFLESFAIDYQYKLLERNFPQILLYKNYL